MPDDKQSKVRWCFVHKTYTSSGVWCGAEGTKGCVLRNPAEKVVPLDATVIPADGKKRINIVAGDDGVWPAPSVKAAGDRIRGALSGLHPVANSDAQRIGLWVLDALSEGET